MADELDISLGFEEPTTTSNGQKSGGQNSSSGHTSYTPAMELKSQGKSSNGQTQLTTDEERMNLINDGVEVIMDKLANDTMNDPINEERGGLMYFCKECQFMGPAEINEEKYVPIICGQCQSTRTVIGTEQGVRGHFKLK